MGVDGADIDFCLVRGMCSLGTPLFEQNKQYAIIATMTEA